MNNPFTRHPHSEGYTYLSHLKHAFSLSSRVIIAACACILHGIFPFIFVTTLSTTLKKIVKEFDCPDQKNKP